MRRALCSALIVSLVGLGAAATLTIEHFDATIELREDGVLEIAETLTVDFLTPHHGIERSIPVSYRVPGTGENLTIDFELVEVRWNDGTVPVSTSRRGRDVYLRIGDPDRTIRGTHVYQIAYTIDRALLFGKEYFQLYCNVTGHDTSAPTRSVTATIELPDTVDPTSVVTTSYSGYEGKTARGEAATLDVDGRWHFTGGPYNPREGLTIDLAFPRTALALQPPSVGERILRFLAENRAAALPIVTLAIMILVWARVGRDPRKDVVAPAFVPPSGVHPGKAGVLVDDRIDLRDVSAMVVGLAVKGHLRIEEIDEEDPGVADKVKNLFSRSTPLDYRFVRRGHSTEDLAPSERAVLEAIFDDDSTERTLSSLESRFYKHLPTIRTRLYDELISAGYYSSNPERTRGFYRSLGSAGFAGGIAVAFAFASVYLGIAIAVSGLVVLAFSPIMPRKTRKGVRALEEILGLAQYIRLAEVDRIEFHNAPEKSPDVFERTLPYAIALNLTKVWTSQFEGLMKEPPEWYDGASPVFRGHLFALSMGHLSAGMDRTFASAPRTATSGRSAWGGRSSFGGGFSGGGFGGGGVGGW